MKEICYLCSQPISCHEFSGDHVVPKQLIKRKQAKAKGFDYAGKLPSHAKCNNQFGPEIYCKKAMSLIRVLQDEKCFLRCQHRDDPDISMLAINTDYLSDFTQQDLRFFKFIDVRNKGMSEWSEPSFFVDKPKTDPLKRALFVSLSVLTKSAAALLVSRKLRKLPTTWRIIAIPYYGKANVIDFSEIVGNTKPFDIGVKVWLHPVSNGNWWVIYKASDIVVFIFFWFSEMDDDIREITPFRSEAQCFVFRSQKLIDLIDYRWSQI